MTDLRTAALQALETLEALQGGCTDSDDGTVEAITVWCPEVIDALRAALAEPQEGAQHHRRQHMSREVCGICWCPYDEETGECACKVPSDCADSHQPVAWRWGYRSITTGEMDWRGYVEIAAHPNLRSPEIIMEPLYTTPPQRKPLSAVDLRALYDQHAACQEEGPETSGWWDFARAIEWAHGIGGDE